MKLNQRYIKSVEELQSLAEGEEKILFVASQTSTVIPYHLLEQRLTAWAEGKGLESITVADLSRLPKEMDLDAEGNLHIKGMVTWEEAIAFCQVRGRTIMTYPTEQLAAIPAGVATSATGERCFGFGTLRNQVRSLSFVSGKGELIKLSRDRKLDSIPGLDAYRDSYKAFENFKNAPFPRFDVETDLLTGTEGQLGPIVEVELETTPLEDVRYFFILLPPWEETLTPHLELFEKVQAFKGAVLSCELLDRHCMSLLSKANQLGSDQDVMFLEVRGEEEAFDQVFEELLMDFEHIDDESIFEISEERFHEIRAEVPRAIFENNQRMGVEKKGTDIQVRDRDFKTLLETYLQGTQMGLPYFLFGHFGNAHLHFNFLPKADEVARCNEYFEDLYADVLKWQGSPFAEHGIGLIKQRYIQPFLSDVHYRVFRELKQVYDPKNLFFPMGFMNGPHAANFSDS